MEPLTRQMLRQIERQERAALASAAKQQARKEAQRERLERQTRREKAEFYGRAVASLISPSRSRITKRKVQKGKLEGRILTVKNELGRERQYHATKGWRSYRIAA